MGFDMSKKVILGLVVGCKHGKVDPKSVVVY